MPRRLRDKLEGCTLHIGGVTGVLESPGVLREVLHDYGGVLAVTLRFRPHRVRDGVLVEGKFSWALATFESPSIADEVVRFMLMRAGAAWQDLSQTEGEDLDEKKLQAMHARENEALRRVPGGGVPGSRC